jgi:hypothetical protein
MLEVSVQNFTQLGGSVEFLRSFIWSRVSSLMRFCDGSDKFCANLAKRATETLETIIQAFGEGNLGRTWTFNTHRDRNRAETGEEQSSRACSSPSLKIKGTADKEFVLADPTVNSAYYSDVLRRQRVKICEDFAPNFGDKRTGCCITTTHRLTFSFPSGNILPKPTRLSSPPTLLFSVSAIEDKTERPPF